MRGVAREEDVPDAHPGGDARLHLPGPGTADVDVEIGVADEGANDLHAALGGERAGFGRGRVVGEVVGPPVAAVEGDEHAGGLGVVDPPQQVGAVGDVARQVGVEVDAHLCAQALRALQPHAELVAQRAGRSVGRDHEPGSDLRLGSSVRGQADRDGVVGVVDTEHRGAEPDVHGREGRGGPEQDRLQHVLRAGALDVRRVTGHLTVELRGVAVGDQRAELGVGEPGDERASAVALPRQTRRQHLLGDPPAAEDLEGAPVHHVPSRVVRGRRPPFDEQRPHPEAAETDGRAQPGRAAPDHHDVVVEGACRIVVSAHRQCPPLRVWVRGASTRSRRCGRCPWRTARRWRRG